MAFTPYAAANIGRKNETAKEIWEKVQDTHKMRQKIGEKPIALRLYTLLLYSKLTIC